MKFIIIIAILILIISFFLYNYKKNYKKKLKIAVVAIGKMENHYIREWVNHYYNLGFNKIFL